jgi:hypothetical protein
MIFFDILVNKKNLEISARYLENTLLNTLSDIYRHEWKSKEKYFKQKIKNPDGINWKKLMDLNFKRLNNFLKKFFGIIENDDYELNIYDIENKNKIPKRIFSQESKTIFLRYIFNLYLFFYYK